MYARFTPLMDKFTLKLVDMSTYKQTKTFEVGVNDKLVDVKYIDSANQEQKVSGILTGVSLEMVADMPYENGNVDLTPEVLSSYEINAPFKAVNDGRHYVVTTLRIKPDAGDGVAKFSSLYIPVAKITDVSAVTPADTLRATVLDIERREGAKVTPKVVEAAPNKAE